MTTKIQMTRKMIVAPILAILMGFMIHTSAVHAQSRGSTSGRQSKTEKAERKPSSATKKKATSNSSSRGSSRQRATQSSNRGSSNAAKKSSNSGSSRVRQSANRNATRSGSASNSRQQSSDRSRASGSRNSGNNSRASGSRNSSNNSRASSSRQSNAGRSGSGNASSTRNGGSSTVRDRATSSSRVRNGQPDKAGTPSGRSSGSVGTRQPNSNRSSGSTRTDDRRRSGNNGSANNRRQSDSGRSSGTRRSTNENSSRGSSATTQQRNRRSSTTVENSRTRQNTRVVTNNGRRSSSGRGTVNDRSNTRVVDNRRGGVRRDATGVRVRPARDYGWRDSRSHYVYKDRKWRYKHNRVYVNPVYVHRPHVQVNVVWPWQNRYRRAWRPSYRYCQVVYVETGYRGQHNRSKVDIRTNYHHEVRYADHRKAVVDIYIDEIEVYENGYYLGKVRRFPKDLKHIEATIYRDGEVVYDRDVFIVGDPYVGFEMIATRSYDGYVYDHYDRSHGMDVGRLNFKRKRVDSRRYSKLFDPYGYNSHALISVLPDDEQLLDYGYDAISYHHYDDSYDPYYGGSYDDDYYDYDNYGNYDIYNAPRRSTHGSQGGQYGLQPGQDYVTQAQPLTLNRTQEYKTNRGLAVKLEREATLERLK